MIAASPWIAWNTPIMIIMSPANAAQLAHPVDVSCCTASSFRSTAVLYARNPTVHRPLGVGDLEDPATPAPVRSLGGRDRAASLDDGAHPVEDLVGKRRHLVRLPHLED